MENNDRTSFTFFGQRLHRAGSVSSEDLKEAIDDMRQAENELDAVKRA
ncbi:TPA: hypothetical protein ACMDT1_003345 [Vibrio parahaemolyticus]